jgi:hypothetical protein
MRFYDTIINKILSDIPPQHYRYVPSKFNYRTFFLILTVAIIGIILFIAVSQCNEPKNMRSNKFVGTPEKYGDVVIDRSGPYGWPVDSQ